MNLSMDARQNTFTLVDVVKIVTAFVLGAVAWATITIGLGNVREDVGEIRATQVDNTRKNEIRDEIVEKRLSQIETNQKMTDMRMDNFEKLINKK